MTKRKTSVGLKNLAVIVASGLFVINLAVHILVRDPEIKTVLSDFLFPLDNLLVAIALFVTAWQFRKIKLHFSLAWGVLAFAQLIYASGDFIWAIDEVILKIEPFPSVADVLYLLYYPLFFLGIMILTSNKVSKSEGIRQLLDNGIVLLSAILGVWNFLLVPLISINAQETWLAQVLSLAYPIGDLVMLYGLLMLLYKRPERHNPTAILLFVVAISMEIIADCIFGYESQLGIYQSGDISDIFFLVSYFFTGLTAIYQSFTLIDGSEPATTGWSKYFSLDRYHEALIYLPYGWAAVSFGLLIWHDFLQLPMNFFELSIGVGIIIAMVLIRQILFINDYRKLNHDLKETMEKVKSQAEELEDSNQKLQLEIYERMRMEEQLTHDAMHDGLTGLPNRVLFVDRLGQAIEYSMRRPDCPFSVLFLDLDSFKVINDSLGHSIGDKLLIAISHRLREILRSGDTIARLGGDEFVILVENAVNDEAVQCIASRIQDEIRKSFNLEGHTVYVSTSIGIVSNILGYSSPEEVLRDADIAMYQAKAQGKARYEMFDNKLRTRVITRLEVENELRQAVERHEFELFYQPILSLATDQLTGFEALIRWNHPERGLLLPAEFIDIAEETGLIIPIGYWVLDEACTQMKRWQIEYPNMVNLSINVNISGKQFGDDRFVEAVLETLHKTGLAGEYLKLEITESVLIDNYAHASEIFAQLIKNGVQLEIDDFGTKYSSLSYLQNFPIQTIKIDKSFVQRIGDGGKSNELIRAIVSMARELGMDTIAEGVETSSQLAELKNLSCGFGQGFYLSKPITRSAVLDYLNAKGASVGLLSPA